MATTSYYSTQLMGAFELQYKRTEDTLKSTLEVASYFRKLGEVETDYSKALLKLNMGEKKLFKAASKQTEKEIGTLKDCWENFNAEIDSIANRHQLLSNQITTNISQEIIDYVKEKETERKRLVNEGLRATKEYKDVISALKKAQSNYYSKCREAESAQQAHEKAKTDPSIKPKELNKLLSKQQKALEVANTADSEYNRMIKKANSQQSKFYQLEMPALLKDFQTFEEERISFMKMMFNKFTGFWNEIPPFLTSSAGNLKKAIDTINKDSDVKQYANENQTSFTIPAEIQYEPFPDNPSFNSGAAHSPPLPQPGVSQGAYKPPAAAAAAEAAPKVYGLTDADAHLSKDAKIQKLKDQHTELRNAIRLENKSRQGLERLVKFYKSMDPQAQEVSRDKLEEQNRKLDALRASRNLVVQQLADLGVQVAASAGDEEDGPVPMAPVGGGPSGGSSWSNATTPQRGADDIPPPPPPPSSANLVKVRCLYDYEATNDSELSFSEGDTLIITEQDDSGWWYAELNGNSGFIPNNYVVQLP